VTDDGRLVEAARAGDEAAFDELVRRHMEQAFAVALRVTGHRQDAEDLVQESFMAALRGIAGFDPGRPFGPWLVRIVLNRGINLRKARRLRHTDPIPAECASPQPSPLEWAARSELRGHFSRALATLSEPRRQCLELFEMDGFTGREIAVITGLPESTVRWHVQQARAILRESLRQHGEAVT
jgi:RNA polymerase sigma factor (sigma-70 family)